MYGGEITCDARLMSQEKPGGCKGTTEESWTGRYQKDVSVAANHLYMDPGDRSKQSIKLTESSDCHLAASFTQFVFQRLVEELRTINNFNIHIRSLVLFHTIYTDKTWAIWLMDTYLFFPRNESTGEQMTASWGIVCIWETTDPSYKHLKLQFSRFVRYISV